MRSLFLCAAALSSVLWAWEASAQEAGSVSAAEVGDIEVPEIEIKESRVLRLEEALALLDRGSPDLKAVRERLGQASLLRDRAYAVLIPKVSLQSIMTVYDDEVVLAQGPVFVPGEDGMFQAITPDPVVVRPQVEWRNVGTVSSTFDARIFPLLDATEDAEAVAQLGEVQVRHQLRYGVVMSVMQLMTLRELMQVAELSIKARETLLEAAVARRDGGVGTEFEVTRARVELLKARKDRNALRLSYLKAREALALLLVTEADFGIEGAPSLSAPSSLEGLLDRARQENPQLKVARRSVSLGENTLRTSEWAWVPTLTLQLNATQQPETLFSPGFVWNAQVIAGWDLYDGGTRAAQIEEDSSKLRQAQYELEKQEQQVVSQVRQAWLELESRAQQREVFAQEVKLGALALQQAQEGYRLDAVPQLEVINAEIQLRIARTQLANEELAYQIALYDLYRLSGQDLAL
jgi:outer membrane protein TolC